MKLKRTLLVMRMQIIFCICMLIDAFRKENNDAMRSST